MATGSDIDDATLDFADSYCTNHGSAAPTKMTEQIQPAFATLGDGKTAAYNDYTDKLSTKGVTKFLGLTEFTESKTWQQLSDSAFDAQSV